MKARNQFYQKFGSGKAIALAMLAMTTLLTGCGATEEPVAGDGSGVIAPVNQCIPINTQIPFSFAGGAYAYRKIVIGSVPGTTTPLGSVLIGGAATTGSLMGSGVDGMISLQVVPVDGVNTQTVAAGNLGYFPTYGAAANPVTINGAGIIQIRQEVQSDIANKVALGAIQIPGLTGTSAPGLTNMPTLNGGYLPLAQQSLIDPAAICVSNVAINLNLMINTNRLYLGDVYLYLNNTPHGYKLSF